VLVLVSSALLYRSDIAYGASLSSQVVQVAEEVLVVVELLQVNVLLLLDDAILIEAVVILGNLVGILARGWYFDGAGPV